MAICNSSEKKIHSLNMSLFSSLKKKKTQVANLPETICHLKASDHAESSINFRNISKIRVKR